MRVDYVKERPKVLSSIYHQQRAGCHLLLHPDRPIWIVINELGWEIIHLCDGKHNISEITSSIADKYSKNPSDVYIDINNFLTDLSRNQFLINENNINIKEHAFSLKRLHLNITEQCNLKCIHCGVEGSPDNNTWIEKDKAFKIIDELSHKQDASLAISGGEPLLHNDCLDILIYASRKVNTSLSTNATLINEEIAERLSFLDIKLQISLDGFNAALNDSNRGNGSFDKALRGIKLLQQYGAAERIILFVTVMKNNMDFISEMLHFAEKMAIPSIRFLPVQKIGRAMSSWDNISPTHQDYSQIYNELYMEEYPPSLEISRGLQGLLLEIPKNRRRWCNIGRTLFINSRGDIYPCSIMVYPDFYLGNINDISLKEALESKRLLELINVCSSRENNIKKCKDCVWKNFCQASCPGTVFSHKGNLLDTDDLCDLRQRLYPEVIFDIAERKTDSLMLERSTDCMT